MASTSKQTKLTEFGFSYTKAINYIIQWNLPVAFNYARNSTIVYRNKQLRLINYGKKWCINHHCNNAASLIILINKLQLYSWSQLRDNTTIHYLLLCSSLDLFSLWSKQAMALLWALAVHIYIVSTNSKTVYVQPHFWCKNIRGRAH